MPVRMTGSGERHMPSGGFSQNSRSGAGTGSFGGSRISNRESRRTMGGSFSGRSSGSANTDRRGIFGGTGMNRMPRGDMGGMNRHDRGGFREGPTPPPPPPHGGMGGGHFHTRGRGCLGCMTIACIVIAATAVLLAILL